METAPINLGVLRGHSESGSVQVKYVDLRTTSVHVGGSYDETDLSCEAVGLITSIVSNKHH